MRAIHPGEVLKEEIIEAKGLTITETARLLGVTRTNLSNIANQKSDISPEMAYRVALVFGGVAAVDGINPGGRHFVSPLRLGLWRRWL